VIFVILPLEVCSSACEEWTLAPSGAAEAAAVLYCDLCCSFSRGAARVCGLRCNALQRVAVAPASRSWRGNWRPAPFTFGQIVLINRVP